MIRTFHGNYGLGKLRMLFLQVCYEFRFGLRRADHQNLMRAFKRRRHIVEEFMIRGGAMAAVLALTGVHPLMLVARLDVLARLLGGREMPGQGFLMINPDYGMIMRHRVFLCAGACARVIGYCSPS